MWHVVMQQSNEHSDQTKNLSHIKCETHMGSLNNVKKSI